MSVSFRLGEAGWYCVTKGSIFLGAVLFCCASDNSLSENLISDKCFSTILAPRIPVFYTLTKIQKPTPVGRPIISGCDAPTERISAFVDHLIQPIAQKQASYLKDTTDFLSFIEKTKLPRSTILVSMDVTSLYTNIPQGEGITTVCEAYEEFYEENPPIPTRYLREMLSLILQEKSFVEKITSKLMEQPWGRKWP